jgi:hypothetical protein
MLKRIALLVFALSLILSQPVIAQTGTPSSGSATTGTISGILVNKTASSTSSVTDQALNLEIYQGSSRVDSRTTLSDSMGKFVFDGLSTDSSNTYQVTTVYQTAGYFSDPIQFADGETEKTLEMDVYDTTSSSTGISVMMAYVILHFENNTLSVKEDYLVANTGDRAFTGQSLAANGGNLTTLNFTLPAGAANFQTIFGLDLYNLTAGNQVYSSEPVTPAGSEISYAYTLPCDAAGYNFILKMNYKVGRLDFLTSDAGMKISGSEISQQDSLTISNLNFQDYSMTNLEAGTVITARLSFGGTNYLYYLLFLLLIPAGLIAVIVLRRGRRASIASATERERLISEIAQLDDDFEDGKIEESVYRRLREEKKRQLISGGG